MNGRFDALRQRWEELTERERRLVAILGAVALGMLVFLPFFLLESAIGALEEENEAIVAALREIDRAESRLAAREAEAAAAEERYQQRAPELGDFLAARSREREMSIGAVNNQPEVQEGAFRRRHVRAQFPGTGLWAAVRLMEDVEGSPFPVALERVHIDHFGEGDRFNVELGVITYDRTGPPAAEGDGEEGSGSGSARRTRGGGAAGPPRPE